MCWIGTGPARIAERDIVVYKLGYVIETTKSFGVCIKIIHITQKD